MLRCLKRIGLPSETEEPDVAVTRPRREVTVPLAGGDRGVPKPPLYHAQGSAARDEDARERVPQPVPGNAAQAGPSLRAPEQFMELPWTQTRAVLVQEHELALVLDCAQRAHELRGERHGPMPPALRAGDLFSVRSRLPEVNHPGHPIDVAPADRDLLSHPRARGEREEQQRSFPFVSSSPHQPFRFLGPVPLPLRIVDLHLREPRHRYQVPPFHRRRENRAQCRPDVPDRLVLEASRLTVSLPRGPELLFFAPAPLETVTGGLSLP